MNGGICSLCDKGYGQEKCIVRFENGTYSDCKGEGMDNKNNQKYEEG